jgi:hypothetical protein
MRRGLVVPLPRADVRFAMRVGQLPQQRAAAFGAEPARFGAQATVRVVRRVPQAFRVARGANARARFQLRAPDPGIEVAATRQKARGGAANRGTVQVELDAASESPDVALGEATVRARIASQRTGRASLHAGRLSARFDVVGRAARRRDFRAHVFLLEQVGRRLLACRCDCKHGAARAVCFESLPPRCTGRQKDPPRGRLSPLRASQQSFCGWHGCCFSRRRCRDDSRRVQRD